MVGSKRIKKEKKKLRLESIEMEASKKMSLEDKKKDERLIRRSVSLTNELLNLRKHNHYSDRVREIFASKRGNNNEPN